MYKLSTVSEGSRDYERRTSSDRATSIRVVAGVADERTMISITELRRFPRLLIAPGP